MFVTETPQKTPTAPELRRAINRAYRQDETEVVETLLAEARITGEAKARAEELARDLVGRVREDRTKSGGLDSFLHEYDLTSKEGLVLMCLAEALLRVPDAVTADELIQDKIGGAKWEEHLGKSSSIFVNASTLALMLTGRVVNMDREQRELPKVLAKLIHRSGEPVIRQALRQAMRIMGRQFVMGRNIKEAIDRAKHFENLGYRYSYDMLGEAARTREDADRYFRSYSDAIQAIGKVAKKRGPKDSPGISVKLSALHPRYEVGQAARLLAEIVPLVVDLAEQAKAHDIGFTIDAEEADRLDLSLDVIEAVARAESLRGWDGLGLALQAYQKRAHAVIDWIGWLAEQTGRQIMVRLVKGAYWDTEVKRSQELGLSGYPVFTRKPSTDVSYLACAKKLFSLGGKVFPQFATHNAHTLAVVMELAGNSRDYEFQRLHGMGEELYEQIVPKDKRDIPCRIYAPVGSHEDLLAYLVRRLLENGANSSFVNRIVDEKLPVEEIVADPVDVVFRMTQKPHPKIPLPKDLYGATRANAKGCDLSDKDVLSDLKQQMEQVSVGARKGGPIIGGASGGKLDQPVTNPADRREVVGHTRDATGEEVDAALAAAQKAFRGWDATPANARAACLRKAADLMEQEMPEIMALCTKEAGKSLPDGVAEVREAIDFCRYYADRAEEDFAEATVLPGPTGERNTIKLTGRGVFLCISPWNFPFAIFCGQVTAALAAGNTVIAKPAEQTSIIAAYAVDLLHRAGVPGDVLHLVPGRGETVGAKLVNDPRIQGVCFTGSTQTARLINKALADRKGPIVPLIAETGGQNAMIVDSSALPEQVTRDVLISSFQSAGQRCSALRVLFAQEDIADDLIKMISGAMDDLVIGNPALLKTDVGPVIDDEQKKMLDDHVERMAKEQKLIKRLDLGEATKHGTFVAPAAIELKDISVLEQEMFGPILHIIRWKADKLEQVAEQIENTGYGLTFGIHTRVDSRAEWLVNRLPVGNSYVNRNMIGAIVGVQPFGGEGLSGTGPKAGGPRYLHRFATERTVSVDTTAAGGNASLMSMQDEL